MTWGKVSLVCWFVTLQAGHTVKILGDGQQLIRTEVGHSLSLDCEYKLEGDSLYSLKWYRDDREFFRYIPQESPPVTIFLLHGISVSDSSSPTRWRFHIYSYFHIYFNILKSFFLPLQSKEISISELKYFHFACTFMSKDTLSSTQRF